MDLDPTRYEPNPHPKPKKGIFTENPLDIFILAFNILFTYLTLFVMI